jgi:site-specific DNA-methyltransferase (adenine-specific)
MFDFRFELVWNKKRGLWFSNYEPTRSHELIWCFKHKNAKVSDLYFDIDSVKIKGKPYKRINKSMKTDVRNKWEVRSYDCKDGLRYPKSILKHAPIGGNDKKNIHPTQKPEMLIEWIVKSSSKEGDLVLDSFSGSGTTAVVCKRLRRNFIGFEKDKKYYKVIPKNTNRFI